MKHLLLFLLFLAGFNSFAAEQTAANSRTKYDYHPTAQFDTGKNKKARKGKRANRKRKRRCHRSARRGFAG